MGMRARKGQKISHLSGPIFENLTRNILLSLFDSLFEQEVLKDPLKRREKVAKLL